MTSALSICWTLIRSTSRRATSVIRSDSVMSAARTCTPALAASNRLFISTFATRSRASRYPQVMCCSRAWIVIASYRCRRARDRDLESDSPDREETRPVCALAHVLGRPLEHLRGRQSHATADRQWHLVGEGTSNQIP